MVAVTRYEVVLDLLLVAGMADVTIQVVVQFMPDPRGGDPRAWFVGASKVSPVPVRRFFLLNIAIFAGLATLRAVPDGFITLLLKGGAVLVGVATRHLRARLRDHASLRSAAPKGGVIDAHTRMVDRVLHGDDEEQPSLRRFLGEPEDPNPRFWLVGVMLLAAVATVGVIDDHHGVGFVAHLRLLPGPDLTARPATDAMTERSPSDDGRPQPSVSDDTASHAPDDQADPLPCADDITEFLEATSRVAPELTAAELEVSMRPWLEVGAEVAGCPSAVLARGADRYLLGLSGAVTGPTAIHITPNSASIVYSDELPYVLDNFGMIREIEARVSAGASTYQLVKLHGSRCTVLARPVNEAPVIPPSAVATGAFEIAAEAKSTVRAMRLINDHAGQQTWEVELARLINDRRVTSVMTVGFRPATDNARFPNGLISSPGCPSLDETREVQRAAERLHSHDALLKPTRDETGGAGVRG